MDGDVRAALASAIAEAMASARPIVTWGEDDCVMFVADPIRKVLGFDPAAPWRGTYGSREKAQLAIGPKGLVYAMRRVATRHGWRRIDPAAALPGDVGLLRCGQSITAAICRAPGWFVMRSDDGFAAIAARHIRLAWSIA